MAHVVIPSSSPSAISSPILLFTSCLVTSGLLEVNGNISSDSLLVAWGPSIPSSLRDSHLIEGSPCLGAGDLHVTCPEGKMRGIGVWGLAE